MSKIINNRVALANIADLTTPSLTQKYKLGKIIEFEDTVTKEIKKYMYVKSHAGLTQYQPYVLDYSAISGSEFITAAPATVSATIRKIAVPQVAFTSGYYGFVLIEGIGKVLMTAETYAVGDHLQVLNAGTALVVDGTTGSTVYSEYTCAICLEAGTTAVARDVFLINTQMIVSAT